MLYQVPAVFLCFLTNKSFWFDLTTVAQFSSKPSENMAELFTAGNSSVHYLLEDKTSRYVISGNPWVTTLFHEGGITGVCFYHCPQCSCSESDHEEIALKK